MKPWHVILLAVGVLVALSLRRRRQPALPPATAPGHWTPLDSGERS